MTRKVDRLGDPNLTRLGFLRILALGSEDTTSLYAEAVEEVANVLRPRFESGELRGWTDEDGERCSAQTLGDDTTDWRPPLWRIERACSRLFIRSPEAAVLVMRHASAAARRHSGFGARWDLGAEESLGTASEELMGLDVLNYARDQGWSKPKPGEEPKPRRARRAALSAKPRAA